MLKKIYRLSEVINITGLSRSSIYLALSKGEFPKPVRLRTRAMGWSEDSIKKWLNGLSEATNEDNLLTGIQNLKKKKVSLDFKKTKVSIDYNDVMDLSAEIVQALLNNNHLPKKNDGTYNFDVDDDIREIICKKLDVKE